MEAVRISELAKRSQVPAPTLKHYLREGLLGEPLYGNKTIAYYDARLADRVRVIKMLQAEKFLPLKIIGEVLEPAPSAKIRADLDEVQRRQLGALAPAIEAGAEDGRRRRGEAGRRSTAQVLEALQITEADLALLAELGLATPVDGAFTGADLALLEVIDETRRKGLGELFPMEILEPYARALRQLVQFELDLFRRRVLGGAKLPAMPLDELTREVTALGERLVTSMRATLVLQELKR